MQCHAPINATPMEPMKSVRHRHSTMLWCTASKYLPSYSINGVFVQVGWLGGPRGARWLHAIGACIRRAGRGSYELRATPGPRPRCRPRS